MIILDTHVLSELMRPNPARQVAEWIDNQDPMTVAITAITVAEILYGVERMPRGRRKQRIADRVAVMFDEHFAGRILAFDSEAAVHYARGVAAAEQAGRPVSMADAQIAAICAREQATLATGSERDFKPMGVDTINPWLSRDSTGPS